MPLLVGLWGLGLLAAGVFVTDPVSGYPQGSANRVQHTTVHGNLHDLFSIIGFISLLIACFVLARLDRSGWAWYSIVTGIVFATFFILASTAFRSEPRSRRLRRPIPTRRRRHRIRLAYRAAVHLLGAADS